jgi:hypothetical protein
MSSTVKASVSRWLGIRARQATDTLTFSRLAQQLATGMTLLVPMAAGCCVSVYDDNYANLSKSPRLARFVHQYGGSYLAPL